MKRLVRYLGPAGFQRRAYLVANAWELVIAVAAIVAAVAFFLYPDSGTRTAVGQVLHPYDIAWNLAYGTSGFFVVFGLVRPSPRVELAGLWLLGAAVTINAVAVVALAGGRAVFPLLTYIAIIIACFVRGHTITTAGRDLTTEAP